MPVVRVTYPRGALSPAEKQAAIAATIASK